MAKPPPVTAGRGLQVGKEIQRRGALRLAQPPGHTLAFIVLDSGQATAGLGQQVI